ncbi:MAG: hypothetical protein ACREJC_22075 [Tepidisphaeraceae bacterium]
MKRIGYSTVMCAAFLAIAGTAFATPAPNSANLALRIFNDCPLSVLTPVNAYPASISINDVMHPACVGFANLHSWSFSEDGGATASLFRNGSSFVACAYFRIEGQGEGEGGLRFGPWWSPLVDGRFMANATSGEIACFGGRLPFYSFTGNHAISYVKGTTIFLQMTYSANGLSLASPATMQYRVIYNAITYDSPVLAYDEGNPGEDPPHGLWGCLNDAMVGGYFQPRANTGASLTATWSDICFTNNDVVPTLPSTWGRIKTLYR